MCVRCIENAFTAVIPTTLALGIMTATGQYNKQQQQQWQGLDLIYFQVIILYFKYLTTASSKAFLYV